MPEARDRLPREDDVMASYSNRRRIIGGGNRNSDVFILEEEAEDQATGTPFRWRGASMVGTPASMGVARRRGGFGSPRFGRSPNFGRSSSLVMGRENMSPVVGRGRGRGGLRGRGSILLPAWYPRKPLRDITAVVRAIERRRARREEGEGLETESPLLQDQIVHDPSVSTSVAQLEQDLSTTSPLPMAGIRHCPPTIGKVPKILLNITNQSEGDLTCLTPQKKLLNNIETVERVVMEELHKLKRTPSAKKAERQKRVRTLMSMR
ncbi:protein POLYCHOME-like [Salvia miltiorrhiza]|uniref:protein POLYCHOME-like n=1 Tax=Salvia miltiorrhiza TaxID=226208 RepID=UPI0025AC92B5|nr:protein POLYCHOME-like [Salvia miltiorrhiza]XP_057783586.1 protein POLYCHOME-like [Salvia miltiorrhiza]